MADSVNRIVPPAISREPVSAERWERERKKRGDGAEPHGTVPADSTDADTRGGPTSERDEHEKPKDKGKKLDIKA